MPPSKLSDLIDSYGPDQLVEEMRDGAFGDIAQIIELISELKKEADTTEHRLILVLHALNSSGVWKSVQPGTFENFLDRNAHVSPTRYANGVLALKLVPIAVIQEISFQAAKVIAKIEDPQVRQEKLQQCQDWVRNNGRTMSSEKARDIAGIPSTLSSTTARREALEQQIASLKTEIQRLRNLVVSLGGNPDKEDVAAE
jgi:septal ring factor EnvC (AmiA/AmiB activator)